MRGRGRLMIVTMAMAIPMRGRGSEKDRGGQCDKGARDHLML